MKFTLEDNSLSWDHTFMQPVPKHIKHTMIKRCEKYGYAAVSKNGPYNDHMERLFHSFYIYEYKVKTSLVSIMANAIANGILGNTAKINPRDDAINVQCDRAILTKHNCFFDGLKAISKSSINIRCSILLTYLNEKGY